MIYYSIFINNGKNISFIKPTKIDKLKENFINKDLILVKSIDKNHIFIEPNNKYDESFIYYVKTRKNKKNNSKEYLINIKMSNISYNILILKFYNKNYIYPVNVFNILENIINSHKFNKFSYNLELSFNEITFIKKCLKVCKNYKNYIDYKILILIDIYRKHFYNLSEELCLLIYKYAI